ncbi:MAG: hypothetical protein PPP58_04785 [Natronomonas sp.]
MTSEAPSAESESTVSSRILRISVVVLFVLGLLSAFGAALDGTRGMLLEALLFVYMGAVLVYGVFRTSLEHPRVQLGLGVGVAAYGLVVYLGGGSILWLIVGIGAALLLLRNGLFLGE